MTPQVISLSSATSTAWIPVDYKQNPYNINLSLVFSNTPNLTCKVEYTLDNIFDSTVTPTAFTHATLTGITSNTIGTITSPVRAIRLTVTSWTSGTVTLTALQGAYNLIEYAVPPSLVSGALAEQAYKLNSSDSIGSNCGTSLLMTTSYNTVMSTIGGQTKPAGVAGAGSNSDPAAPTNTARGVPWTNDTSYVAGTADVSTIVGGYDHVCNQLAGTIIGGGHHFIPYNSGGHSSIFGGSNGKNSGSYSIIAGGTNNTIGAVAQAGIFAGSNNVTASICSGILSGADTEISSNNPYSAVIGGRYSIIGINGGYNAIISGQSNTIQDSHKYVVLSGRDAKSENYGAFTQGRTKLVNLGDCQSTLITFGIRTTTAAATNLTATEGFMWALGSIACSVVVNCLLVGIDEATGATSAYSYTGVVKWDGSTTASVNDAGGTGSTRPFTQIVDDIGVTGLPVLASSTGSIRPQVQGKAATNIKWCCTITAGAVRV